MVSSFKNLKASDGTTKGSLKMPEAAPLVSPTLDNASDAQKKGLSIFTFDRRAQTTHSNQNPNSVLATETQFSSEWGDPNNLKTKSGVKSLLKDFSDKLKRPNGGLSQHLSERREYFSSQLTRRPQR
jgi:hypothetical protein